MLLDSTTTWNAERQRQFWNQWDSCHLQVNTIGCEALRRGDVILAILKALRIDNPQVPGTRLRERVVGRETGCVRSRYRG